MQPYQARKLAFGIGIPPASVNAAVAAMMALAKAYVAMDASLAEINPFILTKDGKVYALDAKINFDDNALYRHKELMDLRDLNEEDPLEVEASRFGLNYIKLDGTVGCMVNGAGLAMATMDIIKYAGGSPANFLDVGGGASAEQVKNAFRILLSDKNVKAVLINIFGGILRCDTLATGVVAAARDLNIQVPIVVRMEGTNVELGRQILMESGLEFHGRRGHARRGGESGRAGGAIAGLRENDERTGRRKHATDRAGIHRQGRHLPRAAGHRLRHQGGGRRGARQGRHEAPGTAGVRHRGPGGEGNRRQRHRDLRAAAVRRRRHHGSGRRRPAAGGVHHRRHSDARHGAGLAVPAGQAARG